VAHPRIVLHNLKGIGGKVAATFYLDPSENGGGGVGALCQKDCEVGRGEEEGLSGLKTFGDCNAREKSAKAPFLRNLFRRKRWR